MHVKILRDTIANGKTAKIGDVLSLNRDTAEMLILLRKAVKCDPSEAQADLSGRAKLIPSSPSASLMSDNASVNDVSSSIDDALEADPDLGGDEVVTAVSAETPTPKKKGK